MAKGQYQNKMESTLPAAEKLEGQSLGVVLQDIVNRTMLL
jgi:hypothetical protein